MLAFFAAIMATASWVVYPATLYEAPAHPVTSQLSVAPALPIASARAIIATSTPVSKKETPLSDTATVPQVPFFSQFTNITSPTWQKVGCGITDLTMLIHYYRPDTSVTVNQMLAKGIAADAYDYNAGWTYKGLINLGKPYGLTGTWQTLPNNAQVALARLKAILAKGPVILSIHYKFDPKSTIPHLVVINAIKGDTVYVNDPATTKGTEEISLEKFLKGWKRRVIIIRPATASPIAAVAVR